MSHCIKIQHKLLNCSFSPLVHPSSRSRHLTLFDNLLPVRGAKVDGVQQLGAERIAKSSADVLCGWHFASLGPWV